MGNGELPYLTFLDFRFSISLSIWTVLLSFCLQICLRSAKGAIGTPKTCLPLAFEKRKQAKWRSTIFWRQNPSTHFSVLQPFFVFTTQRFGLCHGTSWSKSLVCWMASPIPQSQLNNQGLAWSWMGSSFEICHWVSGAQTRVTSDQKRGFIFVQIDIKL